MRRRSREPWYKNGLRFECTQCGECCSGQSGTVQFTELEGAEMAAQLGLPLTQFMEEMAFPSEDPGVWELREIKVAGGYDCVLLGRDQETGKTWCTAHRSRPAQCRTWPFWPENLHNEKAWKQAGRECEGIGRGDYVPLKVIQRELHNTPEWSRTI